MGRENGTQPWIQYDDERAFLEQGELPKIIREVIGGRLAGRSFTLEALQSILLYEHDIPIQPKTLRRHVNALIDKGDVTIYENGGGAGGPRVYQSKSFRLGPTLTDGDVAELERMLQAEYTFDLFRGRSCHTIRARSCDAD